MGNLSSSSTKPIYVEEDIANSRFRVARRTFVDPDVLKAEQDLIFDRCWLYLGHESEIPAANDFITRSVGNREIIFNRDRGRAVHAFLNVCPHRGAVIAREKRGNALGFRCFYHGWAFNNNGNFATKFTDTGSYPDCFNDTGSVNLVEVPLLANYRGLYFINFDRNAVSLEDYLGNAKHYLDLVLDESEVGMEIVGGTQEYSIRANWKLLAENSVDAYHAPMTHSTYIKYLAEFSGGLVDPSAKTYTDHSSFTDLGNGHAVIEYSAPWGRPVAQPIPAWGPEGVAQVEGLKRRLVERFGEKRAHQIANLNRNMIIFPNFVVNDIMAITFRTFYPQAPDFMLINGWAVAPIDETAEFRQRRLFNFLEFLGPGGFATPDDVEALQMCQRGYHNMREAAWNDISKGLLRGPGALANDEGQMRAFWREWNRRITAEG
jgi:p-cumate 2,3-dioxygenase alpha subunit